MSGKRYTDEFKIEAVKQVSRPLKLSTKVFCVGLPGWV